tara:strand:+ start:22 stop:447 length:426 start_codon:yes stop_codon:yes gene_type:complete
MNYINVIGSTKRKRALAESAVIFCISQLMPRMRTLDIELNIKNLKVEEVVGWCYEGENKRDFYIDIDKSIDGEELVEVVCHEMVHVWQAATRKMKDLPSGAQMYMGKVYDETTAYEDEPWEIEAYAMQGGLLEKFKEVYVI